MMMMTKSNSPIDFPVYENLKLQDFKQAFDTFINSLKNTADNYHLKWNEVGKNTSVIIEIINLIQKRRIYFHIFHEKEMGELNEISLACFWILKLKPFIYIPNKNVNINLFLALNLFRLMIERTAKAKGKKIDFPTSHLIHAFKYRDLSKEAIMAIAESLIS